MSVIQSTQQELRYFKRNNLLEESKVIGNCNKDLIRTFGLDCTYYKRDNSEFTDFKAIIDSNTILKRAYGYNITPDYHMSADMIVYPVAQADIFML